MDKPDFITMHTYHNFKKGRTSRAAAITRLLLLLPHEIEPPKRKLETSLARALLCSI